MHALSLAVAATTALLAGLGSASTLTPPVLPLVVRNPYFNAHLQNARDVPWSRWPMFWAGQEMGFSVMAAVPDSDTVYPLLGRPQDSLDHSGNSGYNVSFPKYLGAKYSASVTNLSYSIPAPHKSGDEPVEIVLSFLSPITPTSTLRQAIPASYITVYVNGTFDIDLYMDVNGQWVSNDRGAEINWDLLHNTESNHEPLKTWKLWRHTELAFTEDQDKAEWGSLHFTAPSSAHHESGTSALLRQRFSKTGTLQNQNDNRFRGIMDEEPVFAFSQSFKLAENYTATGETSHAVTFTLAHIQEEVVQFASARGLTLMRPLWRSWFPSQEAVLSWHYHDFKHAKELAREYSEKLAIDAYQSGSDDYVDIVALSARQTMGATSFSGTIDNPLLFLKEISSNGNTQTVDVIFPAFPFFLYTQPRWLAYLLEPLIEHQLSGQYPNKYSMHDLGAHFPNETGHFDGNDEYMPVEECGDMLIMGLALVNSLDYGAGSESVSEWAAQGTDAWDEEATSAFPLTILEERNGIDGLDDRWGGASKGKNQAKKYLERSYRLWKQWTGYLVEFSLRPQNQLSTDDFAGWLALQTNLALKGIVGIKAMSQLSEVVGHKDDAKDFRNISDIYIKKWEEYGISRDKRYAKLAYDWYGSWTTLYSLYADAVLCFHPSITNSSSIDNAAPANSNSGGQKPLQPPRDRLPTSNFIGSHIYKMQSDWYGNVMQKYGLPLDSRHWYTKSDWEFQAAAVASKSIRTEILNRVALWLNETNTDRPFTDLYNTEKDGGFAEGGGPNFFARPVVGSHFAFLTLERACNGKAMEGLSFLDE